MKLPERRAVGEPAPVNLVVEFVPVVKVPELVNKVPEVPLIVNVAARMFKVPLFDILFAVKL